MTPLGWLGRKTSTQTNQQEQTPAKPLSGIENLMESRSTPLLVLPHSKLVENTTKYIQNRLDTEKYCKDWICPQKLVSALAPTKFFKSQNQFLPADNIPPLEADASLLDLSEKGRASAPIKNLEAWEKKARKIAINSHADLFSSAAFLCLQQQSMTVTALSRLLEAVAKSIKHATAMSTSLTTEIFPARHNAASSKLLLDNSSNELRNAPIISKTQSAGRIKEVAKANYEAQQQRFLASTSSQSHPHSQKPLNSPRAFKVPKFPVKQTRPKPSQRYRTKTQTQSITCSNKEDYSKRTGNVRQSPSSKPASSSTKLWTPTLSTACIATPGHSSRRMIGPLCGTMGRIHRQQMDPLYRVTRFQDTVHKNSSIVVFSNQNESIFLTVTPRGNRNPSQETGSGKGAGAENSRLLFPDISCTKKERKVMSNHRPVFTEPIHRETIIEDGDSQVCKTIDQAQRLGCLHRSDRCIPSRSDTS